LQGGAGEAEAAEGGVDAVGFEDFWEVFQVDLHLEGLVFVDSVMVLGEVLELLHLSLDLQ
jgi:hypothetical protein